MCAFVIIIIFTLSIAGIFCGPRLGGTITVLTGRVIFRCDKIILHRWGDLRVSRSALPQLPASSVAVVVAIERTNLILNRALSEAESDDDDDDNDEQPSRMRAPSVQANTQH